MKSKRGSNRAFTMAEVLISIAIIVILIAMGLYAFISAKKQANISTTADTIAAKLEEAKANSFQGKNGTTYGLKVSSTTFTTFTGSSYSSSDPSNPVYAIPSGVTLNTTLPYPNYYVYFNRLTGAPNISGSITISGTGSSTIITIGSLGDISVIK